MEEEKVVLEATNETNEVANENKPNEAPKGEQKESRRFPSNRRQNSKRDGKRVEKRDENNGFSDRVVFINRVSKTVKGGRRMKFTALVAVGNGEGQYGFALAKAAEVPDAVKKAKEAAMKKLYNVHLVKGHTISHEIVGKYGACSVLLKPAPEGTGIIAGGPVRAILELAGVQNVCSKVYGSRAPINIVRAVNQGLENLKSYKNVMSLRNKE